MSESAMAANEHDRDRGSGGPWRVLLLAMVFALIVGGAAFVGSRTVAHNRAVVAPMCVDSGCTFAMSADTSMSSSMSGMPGMSDGMQMSGSDEMPSPGAALGALADAILHLLHLR